MVQRCAKKRELAPVAERVMRQHQYVYCGLNGMQLPSALLTHRAGANGAYLERLPQCKLLGHCYTVCSLLSDGFAQH